MNGESVSFDGGDSTGNIIGYSWRNASGEELSTEVDPVMNLPDGVNVITWWSLMLMANQQ